ncbi:MAG: glycosyltransferase [Candidatus Omnitrophica bacterium]|nr:glycosyltransferase [Candidatus Omnitrophota bacterium]
MRFNSLTIVIPVYNEGPVIQTTLDQIKKNVLLPHAILVIYDSPEDTTLPAVTEYIQAHQARHIHPFPNKYGRGALNAIKTGLESAGNNPALVTMADLSDDLSSVTMMFKELNAGADIVCGSRYMKGGGQVGGPWFKKMLSRLAGVSLYYLAGLPTHDATNSFKMYAPEVLQKIKIESNGGFELGMEITIKAFFQGFKVTEIPTIWHDRTAGKSNFKLFKWLPRYLKWYFLALNHRFSKRR